MLSATGDVALRLLLEALRPGLPTSPMKPLLQAPVGLVRRDDISGHCDGLRRSACVANATRSPRCSGAALDWVHRLNTAVVGPYRSSCKMKKKQGAIPRPETNVKYNPPACVSPATRARRGWQLPHSTGWLVVAASKKHNHTSRWQNKAA